MPAIERKGGTAVWMKRFYKTNLTNLTHSQHSSPVNRRGQTGGTGTGTINQGKMLLFLVVLSLCFTSAQPLQCYVCSSSTTNDACNQNTQECQPIHNTCMTTVDILGSAKAIVKQCASKATCAGAASSASTDSNGNGNRITCCSAYNLCNFSGAESIHVQITLLSLTGVLLLLLK